MRGALLMCVLVLLAALSVHYSQVSERARLPENSRSDPLMVMQRQYDYEQSDDGEATPAVTVAVTADDFAD